jgi:uncharacterized membrane protein
MKKQILKIIFSLLTLLSILSCSNSDSNGDSNQNLSQVPLAKSQYDNSNFGIYKGVFIGSSGTIILDLSNSTNSFTATLIIDGVTHNFITNQTIQQNQTTTINFVEGSNSFTFTVSANGSNPTITNLIINGHPNAALLVVKETSTVLIKCFEGTFSGTYSGTFNAVIYGNIIKAISRETPYSGIYTNDGTVNNNQINASGTSSSGAVFVGNLIGNNFSGTWSRTSDNANGTFTGVRTY